MNTLKINGTEKTFFEGLPETLSHLLEVLDINATTVVAEVDGDIIKREDFDGTALTAGQSIELVRFVGGG
ncbi:sulfur carrier protein ThiS [Planctomycetota bacterium]